MVLYVTFVCNVCNKIAFLRLKQYLVTKFLLFCDSFPYLCRE